MRTTLDYLFRVEPPWIYVGAGEPERLKWNPSHFYSRPGFDACVRRLRGRKMRTVQALMDEVSAALQFFEGFGENWYALEECLQYVDEWLPAQGYVLVVEHAELMLADEPTDEMTALVSAASRVGNWWGQPIMDNSRFNREAKPFHVLLNVSDGSPTAIEAIASIARGAGVPLRK